MIFVDYNTNTALGGQTLRSVEAMKTIAKYEKDCKPQRYCILYHTSNAYCARSPHNGYAYSLLLESVVVVVEEEVLRSKRLSRSLSL